MVNVWRLVNMYVPRRFCRIQLLTLFMTESLNVRTFEYSAEYVIYKSHSFPVTKVIHLTLHSSVPDCVSLAILSGRSADREFPDKNMRNGKWSLETMYVNRVYDAIWDVVLDLREKGNQGLLG